MCANWLTNCLSKIEIHRILKDEKKDILFRRKDFYTIQYTYKKGHYYERQLEGYDWIKTTLNFMYIQINFPDVEWYKIGKDKKVLLDYKKEKQNKGVMV